MGVKKVSGPQLFHKYNGLWVEKLFGKSRGHNPVDPKDMVLALPRESAAASILKKRMLTPHAIVHSLFEAKMALWKEKGWVSGRGRVTFPKIGSAAFGVMPGSFNPVHLGHLTMMMGSLLAGGLDGLVAMPGGDIPNKPFALSHEIRQSMLSRSITDNVGLMVSSLRADVAAVLSDLPIKEGVFASRRRMIDVIAYNLLFDTNPHVAWKIFAVGSDKVREWCVCERNNKELVLQTLKPNNVSVLFFEREGEHFTVPREEPIRSWFMDLYNADFFVPSRSFPTFDVSSTEIRQLIAGNRPRDLSELLPMGTISDIFAPVRLDGKVLRVADAFRLEQEYYAQGRSITPKMQRDKAALFNAGILQNGDLPD